jgi:type II secretory pathway pseudopilin PulG
MNKLLYGITLVELLVAIALIGLLVVGISSLDTYARFYLLTSDRRTQIQNEGSYILEHMTKNIRKAIGSVSNPGALRHSSEAWIKARPDRNGNGRPDDDGSTDWIAYRYIPANYEIQYHEQYPPGEREPEDWPETGGKVISHRLAGFSFDLTDTNNTVFVDIAVCWDPSEANEECGNVDNPQVYMRTRIKMPAVSVTKS